MTDGIEICPRLVTFVRMTTDLTCWRREQQDWKPPDDASAPEIAYDRARLTMRKEADARRVRKFMKRLAEETRGAGDVFLTGGSSAVLLGWRKTTLDVDLELDPEPPGAFDAISRLKDELEINVELASPAHFIPTLPGWRERSRPIGVHGAIRFWHYDFYAQALSKIERGHAQDLGDVREMLNRKLVEPKELRCLFEAIVGKLKRYPAIDPDAFREKVDEVLRQAAGSD